MDSRTVRNRGLCLCSVAACLLLMSGCEYVVRPLKGIEGRTLVYAAVGKGGAPNGGIIVTSLGAVVIDPPLNPELGKRLNFDALQRSKVFWDQKHRLANVQPLSQAPPVLYVLNTTYRATHTFGNQAFAQKADFIATEKAGKHMANLLEGRRMREVLKQEFKVPGLDGQATIAPTITFEGKMSVNTPEVQIKCISVGDCVGEGDAVVFLPQQKILFAGDLVIPGFMPYPKGRTPTVLKWILALRRLEKMDAEVVVPGHGEPGGKDLLRKQREFLETMVLEVRRSITQGSSLEKAMQDVRLPNYARWSNAAKWLSGNVKLVYEELTANGKDKKSSAVKSEQAAGMAAFGGVEKPDVYRDR